MMRCTLVAVLFLAATALAQDMPLSQVLIPGEGWRAVEPKLTVACITTDGEGNLLLGTKGGEIVRLTNKGPHEIAKARRLTAMAWSRDGDLLTVEDDTLYRRAMGKPAKKLADGVAQVAVSPKGEVYYSSGYEIVESPESPDEFVHRLSIYRLGSVLPIAEVFQSNGALAFWPDGGTVVISDVGEGRLFTYRVGKDGTLDAQEGYYGLLPARRPSQASVGGLTLDTDGRLYAATELGVQVFDPTGRMCGVILPPARKPVTALAFAGPARDHLYVVCDGKLYVRKTKVKGFVATAKKPGPKGPG
jgi:gluconolactonase